MDIELQESTKVNNTKKSLDSSFKAKISTKKGKRSKTQANLFAMHLGVNSLDNFKKHKPLKATIKAPIQSCLCLMIE